MTPSIKYHNKNIDPPHKSELQTETNLFPMQVFTDYETLRRKVKVYRPLNLYATSVLKFCKIVLEIFSHETTSDRYGLRNSKIYIVSKEGNAISGPKIRVCSPPLRNFCVTITD